MKVSPRITKSIQELKLNGIEKKATLLLNLILIRPKRIDRIDAYLPHF